MLILKKGIFTSKFFVPRPNVLFGTGGLVPWLSGDARGSIFNRLYILHSSVLHSSFFTPIFALFVKNQAIFYDFQKAQ
jgi:hypothetical protein